MRPGDYSQHNYRYAVIGAVQVGVFAQVGAAGEGGAGGLAEDGEVLAGDEVRYAPLALEAAEIGAQLEADFPARAVGAVAVYQLHAAKAEAAGVLYGVGCALYRLGGGGHIVFYVNLAVPAHGLTSSRGRASSSGNAARR